VTSTRKGQGKRLFSPGREGSGQDVRDIGAERRPGSAHRASRELAQDEPDGGQCHALTPVFMMPRKTINPAVSSGITY